MSKYLHYDDPMEITRPNITPQSTLVRLSFMIPGDVSDALNNRAAALDMRYNDLAARLLAQALGINE